MEIDEPKFYRKQTRCLPGRESRKKIEKVANFTQKSLKTVPTFFKTFHIVFSCNTVRYSVAVITSNNP